MPRLTEQERQEIVRYIEADKPLPDKFRFLLFEDKREVELVWNSKTSEVCNIVLPFQVIEQVDEPRAEKDTRLQMNLFDLDARGRQLKGWTNKLIWGDNKLILSSLKNGPLREEIERQGGIKLIYIDPPFDVGADFTMDIKIGDDTFTKERNILEEIAYRDTWGEGADSYLAMMYERLVLMRDLLAEDGSIYVHCDWRVSGYMRLVLDEVFGQSAFNAEIIWKKTTKTTSFNNFGSEHDTIFYYVKAPDRYVFNQEFKPLKKSELLTKYVFLETPNGEIIKLSKQQREGTEPLPQGRRFRGVPLINMNPNRPNLRFEFMGHTRVWATKKDNLVRLQNDNKIFQIGDGLPQKKGYLDENRGAKANDMWDDINPVNSQAKEKVDYPTQKPEALIERIIKVSTNEGDLVADFFCGSGTTAAVAEKLGRKWIVSDLGKFAIHTTRKRMIGVQRKLKAEGQNYRAFEILNLGKYERQHYIGVNPNLREAEQQKQLAEKEAAFLDLILRAYRAEKTTGFSAFHGKKAGRLVAVGPVNLPVTRLFVEEIILECRKKHITRVDILGFEFEMGLFPNVLDEARAKGIDIAPKYIPAEVFDKRAVEKNQVVFHDVAAIEVKSHILYPPDKGGKGGFIAYNPNLKEKARDNRKNPTPAEKKIWYEMLRNRQFSHLKFTRQKPLGEYIVDFYCAELVLAIEIDGDSHAEQERYDKKRTVRLNELGIKVIRYTNQDVMHNLDGVYNDLQTKVGLLQKKPPKSPLSGGLGQVAVELTDFSVFYSQDSIAAAEVSLKNKRSKIVVERGQIVKVSKDAHGIVSRETLTQRWTDWIDYWAVDFNFESKREIVRVPKDMSLRDGALSSKQSPAKQETASSLAVTKAYEEVWTGDFVFENEWQSFRTKKDRSLELTSVFHECEPGRRKLAVKVVDIFGNDTMTIVEVTI